MKNLLLTICLLFAFNSFSQNLQTYRTYYDVLTKTKLHEEWTAKPVPNRVRGIKHGLYKEFDAAGNLIREMKYENGKQNGYTKIYYFVPDPQQKDCYGKLIGDYSFKSGRKHGFQKDYDCRDGQLILRNKSEFDYGQPVFEKTFHRDGAKESEHRYNGVNKEWNKAGVLIAEYTLANGVEDGPKTLYHDNGQIKLQGTMSQGSYSGQWVAYNDDGSLLSELIKNPDIFYFQSLKRYSSTGKIIEETIFERPNHKVTLYDSLTGVKRAIEIRNYRGDNYYDIVGEQIYYYSTGELKSKLTHQDKYTITKAIIYKKDGTEYTNFTVNETGGVDGKLLLFVNEKQETIWDPEKANSYFDFVFDENNNLKEVREYNLEDQLLESGPVRFTGNFGFEKHGEWKPHGDSQGMESKTYRYGRLIDN